MSKQSRPYRLMTLLESLSEKEFYELGNYLHRHAGNKTNDKIRLYKYLRKHWLEADEGNKPDITSELLQKHIFKKKLSTNDKINTLNSQLVTAIKGFLVEETLNADTVTRNLLLSRTLKKRGLDQLFLKHNEDSRTGIIKQHPVLEASHYDALYALTHDVTFHRDTPKFKTNNQDLLEQTEQHLDMVYILRKLQIICEKKTRTFILQTKYKTPMLSVDFKGIMFENTNNDLIEIYLNIIELYDKESFEIYRKIKTCVINTQLQISSFTRMTFVRLMINYCHRKYGEDKNTYLREICDLYYFAHQNKLLLEDRYMGENDYLNLTKVILASADSWDEDTLLNMANSLKPEYRENGRLLAEAILRFKERNYNEAQQLLLQKVWWRNIEYKLDAYCLLIRTLYEAADYEVLKSKIGAFHSFLKNDSTLSDKRKIMNQNFLDFIREMAAYKAASTPKKEILATGGPPQPIAYGDWCDAKFAELTA